MGALYSDNIYSGFKEVILFPFVCIQLSRVNYADGIEGMMQVSLSSPRVPFPGVGIRTAPPIKWQPASSWWLPPSVGISTVLLQTIIKTVFGDLLLLLYLGNCIQMQINLNPINPLNHVCECACLCARPFVSTHHTCICTYLSSPLSI
jgi:hypothetical protein